MWGACGRTRSTFCSNVQVVYTERRFSIENNSFSIFICCLLKGNRTEQASLALLKAMEYKIKKHKKHAYDSFSLFVVLFLKNKWKSWKHNYVCCHFVPCQWQYRQGQHVWQKSQLSQANLVLLFISEDMIEPWELEFRAKNVFCINSDRTKWSMQMKISAHFSGQPASSIQFVFKDKFHCRHGLFVVC